MSGECPYLAGYIICYSADICDGEPGCCDLNPGDSEVD